MIKKYDNKIGFREFFAIVFFAIGMKLSDTTPILLVELGLNASWMIPIVSGLIILVSFLFLLSLLKLYKNKSLIDIIYHLTGNFFGFLMILLLFLMVLEYLVVSTRDYADILSTLFYLRTPLKYLLIMFIVAAIYIAYKGIDIIGSLCWFTYPLIQLVFVILILLVWKELDFNYLFPLGGSGMRTILKEGVVHSSIVSEIILLSIFFPKVRSYKEYRNANLAGLGISVIFISIFMICFICTYGYLALSSITYPYQQITHLVSLGRFAKNMEAFFLGFWTIGVSVRFGAYFYAAATLGGSLLKIKNPKTLLPYLAIVVYILARLPENFTEYVFSVRKVWVTILWGYLLSLSPFLWTVAKLKGEYKT